MNLHRVIIQCDFESYADILSKGTMYLLKEGKRTQLALYGVIKKDWLSW
jgi:hypothetical protein